MHLLGARFATLEAARSAMREIRASVTVVAADIGVRPLGSTRYEVPANDFLLAGRFETDLVPAVVRAVEHHGGIVVSRQRERPSRQGSARPRSCAST